MDKHKKTGWMPASSRLDARGDVELVVLGVRTRARGFYTKRTRTSFADHGGESPLVKTPGQLAMLHPSVAADENV